MVKQDQLYDQGPPVLGVESIHWAWLRHFQLRHRIKSRRANGELQPLCHCVGSFRPCDVCNMDESAFAYNAVPHGFTYINYAACQHFVASVIFCVNAAALWSL